ncbi:hypothetical protein GGI13_004215 [Coemansia sp. RSA 455]|nr:hypothetical protein GGI14_003792 [Coemansia sp. S680]KAJ2036675.1 hypothetical protein H4S03_003479 [Coemansia sp. S3946]KAJ2051042.1 hypothetical protein GGI08_005353 [Coemansia sp. S2]KAJ2249656.1 hypothetical protein GGI13_004215 [Coemansia sp. RSA 455]
MLSAPDASATVGAQAYDETGFAVTHYVSALRTANAFTMPFDRLSQTTHAKESEDSTESACHWLTKQLAYRPTPRKCIIYLEPRRTSPLYTAIERFFAASALRFGHTEAHMYHPHSSMTGFIDLAHGSELVTRISAHLDSLIRDLATEMPVLLGVNTARDYPHEGTHKIEAKFNTPAVFRDIVNTVQKLVPQARIRPKKIAHISLAYYNKHVQTDNRIEDNAAVDIHELAQSLLAPLLDNQVENKWDIAFYELAFESSALHIPHRFNQIARWHL